MDGKQKSVAANYAGTSKLQRRGADCTLQQSAYRPKKKCAASCRKGYETLGKGKKELERVQGMIDLNVRLQAAQYTAELTRPDEDRLRDQLWRQLSLCRVMENSYVNDSKQVSEKKRETALRADFKRKQYPME